VWSDRITAAGAFWGIVTGFLGNAIAKLLSALEIVSLPVFLDPVVIGLSLSIATILIVSKMGCVTEAERAYRTMIHQIPIGELDERRLSQTLRLSRWLTAAGVLAIAVMIVFYARPYAAGRGTSAPETAIGKSAPDPAVLETGGNMSGELLLAIAYGAVMILTGAIAYRVVKKDYAVKSQRAEES
jgi:sodium/pantothenate symporter